MPQVQPHRSQDKLRRDIGRTVRVLRQDRGWTQVMLAERLKLSQNRLSEIERGDGSFTAEQFLLILKLFNADVAAFGDESSDVELQIQNALARLGAAQLHESTSVLPSRALEDVHDVVREALLSAAPRLVTALAPVLVAQASRLNLARLRADIARLGLEHRLAWVIDNTLRALELVPHTRETLRARVVLELYEQLRPLATHAREPAPLDLLDGTIRSRRTLDEVMARASKPSRRWGIATSLQPEDFAQALEAARVDHR